MAILYDKKISYSIIEMPDAACTWYYDYIELQDKLNKVCQSRILKKVYVSLYNYLDSEYFDDNYRNFDIDACSLILFDNIAVMLSVHGEGMVRFQTIDLCEIRITDTNGYPPDDMFSENDNYFYDLSNEFELSFAGNKVAGVLVDNTNYYPFGLNGYDEQKAYLGVKNNCLPNAVHFKLENGVDFGVYADDIEYFYVKLMK